MSNVFGPGDVELIERMIEVGERIAVGIEECAAELRATRAQITAARNLFQADRNERIQAKRLQRKVAAKRR